MSPTFKKALLWTGAVVFGAAALGSIIGALSAKPSGSWGGALMMLALFALCATRLASSSSTARNRKLDKLTAEATQWAESYEKNRMIPVDTMGVMVPSGERALLSERSQIAEVTTKRRSSFAGTRVSVGKIPLYFGGSESVSRKEMQVSDTGTAVLTDKTLIFAGDLRTFTISLKDVVQIAPSIDAITISSKGRATPVVLAVRNPVLWAGVIRSFASA